MNPFRRLVCWLSVTAIGGSMVSGAAGQQPPVSVSPTLSKPVASDTPLGIALKAGEYPIDLATALQLAGVQNPELLIARERITEAMALKQLAAAQALPNINVGTNYDLHRGPLQQSSGNILQVNRDAMYVGLGSNAVGSGTVNIPGVSYNLNVGTAWFNFLRSKQLVALAGAAARTSQNNTLLNVCLAYSELVRAEARLAVFKLNIREAEELVRLTEAYSSAGQGRKADADRTTVELRKREADLVQVEADAVAASVRLGRLLNLDSAVRLKPTDGAAVPASVVPELVPVTELVAIALMQRPELEERRIEIRQALYELSGAKLLPFSPNVVLGFSTGSFGGGSNLVSQEPGVVGVDGRPQTGPRFGNFNSRVDFDAAVYFTVLNLGVGNVAITRGAASRARQADLRQQETLNRVRAEVVEADARAQSKLRQIDIAARSVEASREAFIQDLIRIRGREGLPIEVIDSVRLLARSRGEYLDAIIDYNRAQFQLYVAIGQPPAGALARPVPPNLLLATPSNVPPALNPNKK